VTEYYLKDFVHWWIDGKLLIF